MHIHIEDARLQQIHVGQFVNVKEIHLPGNSITTLVGSGIERCEDLRSLDLSRNSFDDPAGLIPLLCVTQSDSVHISYSLVCKFVSC